MNILRPAHGLLATRVKSWNEIKVEALELREFIKTTENNVEGYWKKAYAISHAQVSYRPKDFFVVNEWYTDLIELFGTWCVINPKIIRSGEEVYWKEACMSFPHRQPTNVDRFNKIIIEYSIPFLWFTRTVRRKFIGLPAFICQHEIEHRDGKNIYKMELGNIF